MAREPQPIGSLQVGLAEYWPNQQTLPWTPTRGYLYPGPKDGYANRVVVERREHDATLKFFRDGGGAGGVVATVTVPLAVLDALLEADHG